MARNVFYLLLVLSFFVVGAKATDGPATLDFLSAHIVTPADLTGPETNAVRMLVEEIAKRTRRTLPVTHEWPSDPKTAVIAVLPAGAKQTFADKLPTEIRDEQAKLPPEGYRIATTMGKNQAPAIIVVGNDARGVLFGVGKLLRSLHLSRDHIELAGPLNIQSTPAMAIRGHQLGYRPKTNSYDAWDLAQWEQYIRDLAVFGCNAIEFIPPKSDDADDSPHFPLPPIEMMAGMSRLADDYGLDVWIWYPTLKEHYANAAEITAEVNEWREVLNRLPRVDAIFVPFGDPGDASPGDLMAMLEKQAEQLQHLHPGAEMWISMQGFPQADFDKLLAILNEKPRWLTGVVHGPQTRVSVAKLRELLPSRYKLRGYPDITHSMRCEYPVPDWDLAFPLTEGREVINPRPLDETTIFAQYKDKTNGVITYSEGCNDDVNKAIWSGLCWDPGTEPIDTLRDYSRYFIGPRFTEDFAQGLFALEQNWRSPLLTNEQTITTLQQFRTMERNADPATKANWRFQQGLYRATYDVYLRCRLIEETAQETDAMNVLASARQIGVDAAIDRAESILDRANEPSTADGLRARVFELAEALFQSVKMQLSVDKYQAIEVGRGANLDEIDVPLNNRVWLKERFANLRKLDGDAAKLRGIAEILRWTDPGPGGFYDDLGNPSRQPHLVRNTPYAEDPGFLESPGVGFRSVLNWRRSWCNHVDGQFQTPVTMHYPNLDPQAHYKIRIVYAGENFDVKVRLQAETPKGPIDVHPFQLKPQPVQPVEFDIPQVATAGGQLTLTWLSDPERGGPGRGCQIAEVWLLKTSP